MISTYSNTINRTSLITSYELWLKNRNYSNSAIQEYVSQANIFFDYVYIKLSKNSPFDPEIISAYIQLIQDNFNFHQQLSFLSKFFQFCLDQKITTTNPLKDIIKPIKSSLSKILSEYRIYLTKKKYSSTTTRNYLNDIRQFIDWSKLSD